MLREMMPFFAQKVYRIYATTSQYLISYGCTITMVYICIYMPPPQTTSTLHVRQWVEKRHPAQPLPVQGVLPIHEICRFLWILKAKKLFVRVRLSELWAAICAHNFKAKSCALRFSTLQALAKSSITDFCIDPVTFPWQWCEDM